MANKIASFIYKSDDKKDLINFHENWIFMFIHDLTIQFKKIDFLRVDKYLMLSDQVISNYFVACLNNKKFDSTNKLVDRLTKEINDEFYSFSLQANILKIISKFIDEIFKESNKNSKLFIQNNFATFFEKILNLLSEVRNKREYTIFQDFIFTSTYKGLHQLKDEKITKEIKEKCDDFIKSCKNNQKVKLVNFLLKKIENQNYVPELKKDPSIIDPVNNDMLKSNYTVKFRKSPLEKKKELIEKKKELKSKKKQQEKLKKEIPKEKVELEEEVVDLPETKEELKEDDPELVEDDDDDDDDGDDDVEDNNEEIDLEEDYYDDGEELEEYEDDEDEDYLDLLDGDEIYSDLDKPENKQFKDAYNNTMKNMQIVKPSNDNFIGKRGREKNNGNNKKNGQIKKKRVKYELDKNVTQIYDMKKPILLTSKRKDVLPGKSASAKKGLLKTSK